jgi:ribosomal protein L16 Arg81 hydroxylase
MEFDQVITPLSREAFLSDHWEKAWLHIPGTANRFSHLLSWDELNALLENTRMAPPHIRLTKDGHPVEAERFVYAAPGAGNEPRIDPGRLVALLTEGATMVLQGMEAVAPRIRALSDSFREALQARNHVNLYASWRRQNGLDLHWDPHEVMVLQLHGRKRWQIFAPTQDYPLDTGVPPKPTGAPQWDGLLNSGDVLYLPRGWWHIAHPVDEPSMHLTFGIAPMHGLNLLNWMAMSLRSNAHLRRNLPVLEGEPAREAYMAELRAIVADALGDSAIDDFLRAADEHVHGRPSLRLPQAPYDLAAPFSDKSLFRLASSARLLLKAQGDKVIFNAYGKSYSVPAFVRPALMLLNDKRAVSLAQLCAVLDGKAAQDSLKQGLTMLARAGVVLVDAQ